jgi:hypothetical protein
VAIKRKTETQRSLKRHHLPDINPSDTIERRMDQPRNDENRIRATDFGGEQPKIVAWTPFEVFCIKNDGRFSGRGE